MGAPTCVELCAGAGGMATGLERAGWRHTLLVERDLDAARTLKQNNPDRPVLCADLSHVDPARIPRPDMACGGPPCQPFSLSGRRLGSADARDAFMVSLRLAVRMRPCVIMLENVLGLMHRQHAPYRESLSGEAGKAGYAVRWVRIDCSRWGVPQRRRRVIFTAVRMPPLSWWPPLPPDVPRPSLGDALLASGMPPDLIPRRAQSGSCPTITHGGAGPRSHGYGHGSLYNGAKSRAEWERLGIDSRSITGHGPLAPTVMGGGRTRLVLRRAEDARVVGRVGRGFAVCRIRAAGRARRTGAALDAQRGGHTGGSA